MIAHIFTAFYMPGAILSSSLDNPKADTHSLSITPFFHANKTLLLFEKTMCQPQVMASVMQ